MGGALATLAAYDVAKEHPDVTVACYTFGAPRTGNRAFARECDRVVPDNWSIINDQVTHASEPSQPYSYSKKTETAPVKAGISLPEQQRLRWQ